MRRSVAALLLAVISALIVLLMVATAAATASWDPRVDARQVRYSLPSPWAVRVLPPGVKGLTIGTLVLLWDLEPNQQPDVLAHEMGHVLHNQVLVDWDAYRRLPGVPADLPLVLAWEWFAEDFRICFLDRPAWPHQYRPDRVPPKVCRWLQDLPAESPYPLVH